LARVARLLQEILPDTALIARYGGDEFVAALPDTRLDEAFTLFEEFRRRVAALPFEGQPEVHVTSSIGLAAFPTHGNNDVDLLRAADQAMYVSKVSGRNKVSLPLSDSRMVTKTSYYTTMQLERLSQLARMVKRNEASLLREALDDLLKKYDDRFGAPPRG
jgi:predicted signal transduction protein with EAL and GGDEF domain